jgi:hypothetical protein
VNTTIRQSVEYGHAETRGRLRLWKQKLAKSYTIFDDACNELMANNMPLVADMVFCSRTGRKRAFDKINKSFGPGVTLESVNLGKNNRSLAIWSILKPRGPVAIATEAASRQERVSLMQNCVTVNYIVIGCIMDRVQVGEGLWTLEVPDHALGRAVERSGYLHPEALIREAHKTILELPSSVLSQTNFGDHDTQGAYIKSGPGCFAGHFRIHEDVSRYGHTASVRVKTWLDQNQLHENQIILSEKGAPGDQLGDAVLKPSPLCRFQVNGDAMQLIVWDPNGKHRIEKKP